MGTEGVLIMFTLCDVQNLKRSSSSMEALFLKKIEIASFKKIETKKFHVDNYGTY
jgi:hypothetical protein